MDGRCPETQHEIELYHWRTRPEGTELNALEEPEKYLDHAMDAMRYGLMAAFERAEMPRSGKEPSAWDKFLMQKMGVVSGGGVPEEYW